MAHPDVISALQGVAKSYHGVPVLKGVDLALRRATVHVLAGENGAGKSTLIKIMAGIEPLDEGSVTLDGVPVQIDSAAAARAQGIAVVHQELSLVPDMTVGENLVLGQERRRRGGRLDRHANRAYAADALRTVRCDLDLDRTVASLSTGQQQLVEIARALAERPRVLILDEPTAALSRTEAGLLLSTVEGLRADGLAVLYISHRMEEVVRIADEVTVVRDGRVVIHLNRQDGIDEDRIVTAMVGRPVDELYGRQRRGPAQVRLEVHDLGATAGRRASFAVRSGEVLGVAGIVGAGRSELMHLIAGCHVASEGSVSLDGHALRVRRPADAARAGIVMLPESRKTQGLFPAMSIADNICVGTNLGRRRAGRTSSTAAEKAARPLATQLRVKANTLKQPVGQLSGGNQQKVLLARCLARKPKVLILDEPTRGVDVGAKADIYRLISDVAAQGVAVIVVSSDLPEVLGLSDRVLVMRNGHIEAELCGTDMTEEEVMRHATGAASAHNASRAWPGVAVAGDGPSASTSNLEDMESHS